MSEKQILTVVINVFCDKYCDVYFFTQEHKKRFADLLSSKTFESFLSGNTFESFVRDSMCYPLFVMKNYNPEKDLKSLVRAYLNTNFGRVQNMNIRSYFDFSQSYSLEPAFDINDCVMDELYVCDYRVWKLYNPDPDHFYNRIPSLYRAEEFVYDNGCTFHLLQEDLDDVISTVKRCGDELETFEKLLLYAVKDDSGIEVCPFSVGNKDYFLQKAREHAEDKNYLTHKTYVYEYKNGKTNRIYGFCKFNEASNLVSLDLEKENDCNKGDESSQCCENKLNIINNKHDVLRSDKFNFTVDGVEVLSKYCTEVFVSQQKGKIIVKAKFYFNKSTREASTSNAFNIGSEHKLYVSVFNDNLNEDEELLSLVKCVLTKKSYCLNKKGIGDPLEEELTFEAD